MKSHEELSNRSLGLSTSPFCVFSRFLWPSRALNVKAVSAERSALSLLSAVKYPG